MVVESASLVTAFVAEQDPLTHSMLNSYLAMARDTPSTECRVWIVWLRSSKFERLVAVTGLVELLQHSQHSNLVCPWSAVIESPENLARRIVEY